jgi:hypothetical protein
MTLCPNCRVDVGDQARQCPLCRAQIRGDAPPLPSHRIYPEHILDPEDLDDLTPRERRKVFLELYSVCSLIAGFSVCAVNILASGRPTWSLYPLAAFAYLWLLVCIPIVLDGRPWLVFSVLGPSSLAFLFLIDFIDGNADWSIAIAMPIAVILEGAIVSCATLATVSKRKGINVIAIALTGAVLVCAGVELVLNMHAAGRLFISWSAIALAAGLPSAGFLFYTHYRLVNRASLRKLFHL